MSRQRQRTVQFHLYARHARHFSARLESSRKVRCRAHRPHGVRTRRPNSHFKNFKDAGFHGRSAQFSCYAHFLFANSCRHVRVTAATTNTSHLQRRRSCETRPSLCLLFWLFLAFRPRIRNRSRRYLLRRPRLPLRFLHPSKTRLANTSFSARRLFISQLREILMGKNLP